MGMAVILFNSAEPFQIDNNPLTVGLIWNLEKISQAVSDKIFKDYMILCIFIAQKQDNP